MSALFKLLSSAQIAMILVGALFSILGLIPRIATPWASIVLERRQQVVSLVVGLIMIGAGVSLSFSMEGAEHGINLPVSLSDQNAASGSALSGKWRGDITDIDYDEFKRTFRHSVSFDLKQKGTAIEIDGELTTESADTGEIVGSGHLRATGILRNGEYAQIAYSLDNKTVRGFGVVLLQFAPSGLMADGYWLFRRTALQNGRMGFGRSVLHRIDAIGPTK